jgi:hypothetical protein
MAQEWNSLTEEQKLQFTEKQTAIYEERPM